MDTKTLTSVFESHKVDLADKLTGLAFTKKCKKGTRNHLTIPWELV